MDLQSTAWPLCHSANILFLTLHEIEKQLMPLTVMVKVFFDSLNTYHFKFGAVHETRTRDPDLGKVVLYQLS